MIMSSFVVKFYYSFFADLFDNETLRYNLGGVLLKVNYTENIFQGDFAYPIKDLWTLKISLLYFSD